MKRALLVLVVGLIYIVGIVPHASASPNDFSFTSFEADYYLDVDSDKRSTLKTVEKLVAQFPPYDQNHGIERAIPKFYDGHTTSLRIVSVADENGRKQNYTTYDQNDNLVLRIGDADNYVHGTKSYVITYTQRDVTKYFADSNDDEFYWDTNGTEWLQPFGSVTARVHVGDSIKPALNGKLACYRGPEGSREKCDITQDGSVMTASATDLKRLENMTVAIGFTPGTFKGYEMSLWDKLFWGWFASLLLTSGIGLFYSIWLPFLYSQRNNRDKELEPIAPEYIPPKGTSILTSAQIGKDTRAVPTAAIVDLAVRHQITIAETKEKTMFKPAEYVLEIVKPVSGLAEEEQEFVQTLFGSTEVGTKLETKSLKNNYALYSKLQSNAASLGKKIRGEFGLRAKNELESKRFKKYGRNLLIGGLVALSPFMGIGAIVAYVLAWTMRPLTDKGLELRRYLEGLRTYIDVAEKDRIKMLQSPEGAEKTGVAISGANDARLVGLYERVLPYAVLFGLEKEWNKQLAVRYENSGTQPDWYVGHGAFNAAAFSTSMSSFSDSMNSYAASTNSSSGGSGGGGSSGGGGGGGGGGGW